MWSFKTGSLSWQWSLKIRFTVLFSWFPLADAFEFRFLVAASGDFPSGILHVCDQRAHSRR